MGTPARMAKINGPDESGIYVSSEGYYTSPDKGRLTITGFYPRDQDQEYYLPEPPSITVSMKRAPADIARDIQKRFMPDYWQLYLDSVERRKNYRNYIAQRDAEVQVLVTSFPILQNMAYDKQEFNLYLSAQGVYGKIRWNSAESWQIDVSGLKFETMQKIMQAIAESAS
jgi:hypothetical protein